MDRSLLGYHLRPVEISDAEFIVKLRNRRGLSKFIGKTLNSIEDQIHWIENQRKNHDDHYFMVVKSAQNQPIGTTSIYNKEKQYAEWGRWILDPDYFAALPSICLVLQMVFRNLGLKAIYTRTMCENQSVIRLLDNVGLKRVDSAWFEARELDVDLAGFIVHTIGMGSYEPIYDLLVTHSTFLLNRLSNKTKLRPY